MRILSRIITFAFTMGMVILGIVFGNENSDKIQIILLGSSTDFFPKWYVILMSIGLGALISFAFFIIEFVLLFASRRGAFNRTKKLEKRLEKKEEELLDLRNEISYLQKLCEQSGINFLREDVTNTSPMVNQTVINSTGVSLSKP